MKARTLVRRNLDALELLCDDKSGPTMATPDLGALIAWADQNSLRAFTLQHLKDTALNIQQDLELLKRAAHRQAAVRFLRIEQAASEVTELLTRAGIEHAYTKGYATARYCYTPPFLREMADLDLIVRTESFDDAIVCLGREWRLADPPAQGVKTYRTRKASTFVTPDGLEVDLHRRASSEVGRYALHAEAAFPSTSPNTPLARVEFVLLHTAIHLLSPGAKANGYLDISRLCESSLLDTQTCIDLARESNTVGPLIWALASTPGQATHDFTTPLIQELSRSERRLLPLVAQALNRWPNVGSAWSFVSHARDPTILLELIHPTEEFLRAKDRLRSQHIRRMLQAPFKR